jgi:hypothetical protein
LNYKYLLVKEKTMPINPNDPNSVAGNPEGLAQAMAAIPPVLTDPLSVENKVRATIVHALPRYQAPECAETAMKLQQICTLGATSIDSFFLDSDQPQLRSCCGRAINPTLK